MRIGHGYDAHRLVHGRVLILGGVSIPHDRGLLAHSDGDTLIHAICDALLGAAALGDIGKFFPDTQPEWKGVDSRVLLREVVAMLARKGFRITNVDATVVAQRPKLAPYFPAMREHWPPMSRSRSNGSTSRERRPKAWGSPGARKASPPMPSHCSKSNRRGRNRRLGSREIKRRYELYFFESQAPPGTQTRACFFYTLEKPSIVIEPVIEPVILRVKSINTPAGLPRRVITISCLCASRRYRDRLSFTSDSGTSFTRVFRPSPTMLQPRFGYDRQYFDKISRHIVEHFVRSQSVLRACYPAQALSATDSHRLMTQKS